LTAAAVAEFPRYPLVSAEPLSFTVQLTCGCGYITVLTFGWNQAGETGRSYRCKGCGSSHWLDHPAGTEAG
jgi:hypothetical protein